MKTIEERIKVNKLKILKLLNHNSDLSYRANISQAKRFSFEQINFGTKKHPLMKNVKFMYWDVGFKDEDTGEVVEVERKQAIEIDGKKSNHYQVIEYYNLKDL